MDRWFRFSSFFLTFVLCTCMHSEALSSAFSKVKQAMQSIKSGSLIGGIYNGCSGIVSMLQWYSKESYRI